MSSFTVDSIGRTLNAVLSQIDVVATRVWHQLSSISVAVMQQKNASVLITTLTAPQRSQVPRFHALSLSFYWLVALQAVNTADLFHIAYLSGPLTRSRKADGRTKEKVGGWKNLVQLYSVHIMVLSQHDEWGFSIHYQNLIYLFCSVWKREYRKWRVHFATPLCLFKPTRRLSPR